MRADVRKVAARNRSSLINHAQSPIQEDTGVFGVAEHPAGGRTGVRVGVHLCHLVCGHAEVGGDGLDVGRSYVYNRVPAAIGAGRAIRARRNLVGKNMKWPDGKMPGGDVPSEIKVLRLLGFSPAPYFGQIRDHSGRIASIWWK